MASVVLTQVAELLFSNLTDLDRHHAIFDHVVLVGLISCNEHYVLIQIAEGYLCANGVASRVLQCLVGHTPLLVDGPDVDGLVWLRGERCKKLVISRTEGHGDPGLVTGDLC